MIIDILENSNMYNFGEAWSVAFEFLSSLTPNSGLMIDDKEEVVKKVVVKIRAEFLK